MAKLLENISDLNDLVLQGRALEAFDKYYHVDVVIQENENPPTVGKAANRKLIQKFMAAVIEFKGARPLKVSVGQGVSMVEWHYEYTHNIYGEVNYSQISVQEWRNDEIIREKYYYNDTFIANSVLKKEETLKEETLIVLFNLKQGVGQQDYEKYAVEIDSPTIRRLPSNLDFKILRSLNLFGSDTPSPFQYIEVMKISSYEALAEDFQKESLRDLLKQFSSFADRPQLIATKQIN